MISYGKQSISKKDIESAIEVLESELITQGPKINEFEISLKKKFGTKYSCVVSSGTAALHLTALALGWKSDDIIITSPITFLASANAIIYAGSTPDFVDIDPDRYTIDPNKLEDKVKKYLNKGKKIKAVIGIDYAGHPCDWKALRDIANKYEFKLVNDNCHALGASYFGNCKYAIQYADVVTQSYHAVKNITTGEGGSILTNDKSVDEKVRLLKSHGMKKNAKMNQESPWYYEMHEVGFNYRITDLQCALGISQIKKLDNFVKKRRKIASKYDKIFNQDDRFTIPKVFKNNQHAYHLYPLLIKFNKLKKDKNDFFNKMKRKKILLQVHYIPVHTQPFYKKNFNFRMGDFPLAENFYTNEVSIPIHVNLNEKEIDFVIKEIKKNLA